MDQFKVGDRVMYIGEECKVVGTVKKDSHYIITYSEGWRASNEKYTLMDSGKTIGSLGEVRLHWANSCSLTSVTKPKKEQSVVTYKFKGTPNLPILCSEALKDGKHTFALIGKENAVIGLLRGIRVGIVNPITATGITYVDGKFKQSTGKATLPYLFMVTEKKYVNNILGSTKEAIKQSIKDMHKAKRKINKAKAKRIKNNTTTTEFTVVTM